LHNGGGGVKNIPFLVNNADAAIVDATFWIEQVQQSHGVIAPTLPF